MDEQKQIAKIQRNHAEALEEFCKNIEESLEAANAKISDEAENVEDLGKQVKQSIAQIDSLNQKMQYVLSIKEPDKRQEGEQLIA